MKLDLSSAIWTGGSLLLAITFICWTVATASSSEHSLAKLADNSRCLAMLTQLEETTWELHAAYPLRSSAGERTVGKDWETLWSECGQELSEVASRRGMSVAFYDSMHSTQAHLNQLRRDFERIRDAIQHPSDSGEVHAMEHRLWASQKQVLLDLGRAARAVRAQTREVSEELTRISRHRGILTVVSCLLSVFVATLFGMYQVSTWRGQRVQAKLREREALLHAAIESIPFDFWACDADGRYIMQNSSHLRRWGNILGKRLEELQLSGETQLQWRSGRDQALAGGTVRAEVQYLHDGHLRTYFDIAAPIRVEDRIRGALGFLVEITDLKETQQALARSEAHLRTIIETEPACVKLLDTSGVIRQMNPAGLAILQADRAEQVLGKSVATFVPPKNVPVLKDLLALVLRGQACVAEVEIEGLKGSRRILEMHAAPLRDSTGQICSVVSVTHDITERRKMDVALRESEQQFRQLADSITEVFWLLSYPNLELLYVSPAYEQIWGRHRSELLQNRLAFIEPIHAADLPHVKEALDNHLTEGYDVEYRVIRPDGTERWIHDRAFPVRDKTGAITRIAGIAQDITEKKQAAESTSRLLEQVITAQEQERRRIARELHDATGQSLTSLLIGLRALEESPTLEKMRETASELREMTSLTMEEVHRLACGLRPSVLDDLGLLPALMRLAAEFEQTYGIRITLQTQKPAPPRLPEAVETALFRIVQEALTNVVRHAEAKNVCLEIGRGTGGVQLIIQDDGLGFDAGRVINGAGHDDHMGLVSMRERSTLLGGHFTIHSSPGAGSRIRIDIPVPASPHVGVFPTFKSRPA